MATTKVRTVPAALVQPAEQTLAQQIAMMVAASVISAIILRKLGAL